ncbi:MAG: hypothetical protein AAGE98_21245 [Actinomycetota bacterium]
MRRFVPLVGLSVLAACGGDDPDATGYLIDADDGYVVCAEQVATCPADVAQTAFRGFAVADISSIDFIDIDGARVSASPIEATTDDIGVRFTETDG